MGRMLVLVNGLPATGKSTLAPELSAALGLPLLSKDVIKETHADVLGADPPPGLAQREWNRRLGTAAGETMWALLARSAPGAVLESSWRADVRELVDAGLRRAGFAGAAEVWCEAPLPLPRVGSREVAPAPDAATTPGGRAPNHRPRGAEDAHRPFGG